MSRHWFRFYDRVLNDPKIQRLSADTFRFWVNLLCLTSARAGLLPELGEIAFALRSSESEAAARLAELIEARLIEKTPAGLRPHDWDEWQYPSDSSAKRVRKWRAKRLGNVTCNGDVTSQSKNKSKIIEEESDKKEEGAPQAAPAPDGKAKATRGRRLDIDHLPDDWREFCKQERPDLDPGWVWEQFHDHWISSGQRNASKLNWEAAWRVWVRKERPPPANGTGRRSANEAFIKRLEAEDEGQRAVDGPGKEVPKRAH